jgi:hypothetical protein
VSTKRKFSSVGMPSGRLANCISSFFAMGHHLLFGNRAIVKRDMSIYNSFDSCVSLDLDRE